MQKQVPVKCFRDIRDIVFGFTDEEWTALNRDFLYQFTKLDLVRLSSMFVKMTSSHVLDYILLVIIQCVGIEPVIQAEIKLAQGPNRPSRSSHSSDRICNVIIGIVTQAKESIKQALMKYKNPKNSTSAQNPLDPVERNLLDDLVSSSTKAIVCQIIQLVRPNISHTVRKDKPVTFQQIIKKITRTMEHIHSVSRCLGDDEDDDDEDGNNSSYKSMGRVVTLQIKNMAVNVVNDILREAGEKISAEGSQHSRGNARDGPLEEITIVPPALHVCQTAMKISEGFLNQLKKTDQTTQPRSSQNRFLVDAFEIYNCVQMEVFHYLYKIQRLALTKENAVQSETPVVDTRNVEDSDEEVEEENRTRRHFSGMNLYHLDKCTNEVINKILDMYKRESQNLNPDEHQSLFAMSVRDIMLKYLQRSEDAVEDNVLVTDDLLMYLDSATLKIIQSFLKALKDILKSPSQTGFSNFSSRSAVDFTNVFAPYRFFKQVSDQILDVISKAHKSRLIHQSRSRTRGYTDSFYEDYMLQLYQDKNSSINRLRRMFCQYGSMPRQAQDVVTSITTVVENLVGRPNIRRSFRESAFTLEEDRHYRKMRNAGINMLVHRFVPDFLNRVLNYLASTESGFTQLTDQIDWEVLGEGETEYAAEIGALVAQSRLVRTLSAILVRLTQTSATSRSTSALDSESWYKSSEEPSSSEMHQMKQKKKRKRKSESTFSSRATERTEDFSLYADHQDVSSNTCNYNKVRKTAWSRFCKPFTRMRKMMRRFIRCFSCSG